MYPQEFMVDLNGARKISSVDLVCRNAKRISIESCESTLRQEWHHLETLKFRNENEELQFETAKVDDRVAAFVKVRIEAGYDEFVTIHSFSVKGGLVTQDEGKARETEDEARGQRPRERGHSF